MLWSKPLLVTLDPASQKLFPDWAFSFGLSSLFPLLSLPHFLVFEERNYLDVKSTDDFSCNVCILAGRSGTSARCVPL